MRAKGLIFLAGLTIVAVGATSTILRTNPSRIVSDRRGEVVFPDLPGAGGDITLIDIQDGDRSIAIERKDNGFVAAGSNYPVKIEPLRDLVATLANLRFEEAKTADPARYSDLGLGEPGSKGEAGKFVTIKKQNGAVVASLLVGNRDMSVGGSLGGTYAKLGDAQSYLLRGEVKIPSMKADWFDANLVKIGRESIAKIELNGGGRDKITLTSAEAGKELELADVPEGREADASNLSRLSSMMESLDFQDVRKASATKSDAPRQLIAQTREGLRLELTLVSEAGNDSWIRIAASSTNESSSAQAKEIAAKVEGREFRLPGYQGDIFGWSMNEMTTERKS